MKFIFRNPATQSHEVNNQGRMSGTLLAEYIQIASINSDHMGIELDENLARKLKSEIEKALNKDEVKNGAKFQILISGELLLSPLEYM